MLLSESKKTCLSLLPYGPFIIQCDDGASYKSQHIKQNRTEQLYLVQYCTYSVIYPTRYNYISRTQEAPMSWRGCHLNGVRRWMGNGAKEK